jgi:hypothetical protein
LADTTLSDQLKDIDFLRAFFEIEDYKPRLLERNLRWSHVHNEGTQRCFRELQTKLITARIYTPEDDDREDSIFTSDSGSTHDNEEDEEAKT